MYTKADLTGANLMNITKYLRGERKVVDEG